VSSEAEESFLKELNKLLGAAKTQEERNEVWAFVLGAIHDIVDDEEWAKNKKDLGRLRSKIKRTLKAKRRS
jgi:hypothetical protein